jgi:uncharacterized protein (TIGR03437 family)
LRQTVTFTATVSGGTAVAQGTVQFFDGLTLLGTVSLTDGQATFSTAALSVGQHGIMASYSAPPDVPNAPATVRQHGIMASYSGGGSYTLLQATISQTVNPLATTMTFAANPISAVYGQAVALTASVSPTTAPAGFAPPTGQVTFSLQSSPFASTPLGSADLTSGSAMLSVNSLPVGTHYLSASYSGDSTWSAHLNQVVLTVSPASTSTSVSLARVDGQLVLKGIPAAVAPGAGIPTGKVQFMDMANGATVATANLSGGKAAATIAPAAAASVLARPIAAVYDGDGNFQASTSAPLPALVNAASDFSSSFAADEIASIFGVTGMQGDIPASLPMTTSLGGVTVTLTDSAGSSRLAQLYGAFGSAGQLNFLVPGGTAAGPATVLIALPGGATMSTVIDIASASPGIFTANMTGQGPYSGQVVYSHPDGSQTVANAAIPTPGSNTLVPNPINLGRPGDQVYLVLYATGIRHAGALAATVNGLNVPVSYFGGQGSYAGLDQINLGPLPASLAGAGQVQVAITADGQAANPVTLTIQ